MLKGNASLNLATSVGTWIEPGAASLAVGNAKLDAMDDGEKI